jgi:predicted nucleic acid-binding Zn ribbon protein
MMKWRRIMKKCIYCRKEVEESAKICPHCGFSLSKPRKPAGRTALIAIGFLALGMIINALTLNVRPTTQMQAILPGLLVGVAIWVAIILFIVAAVQAILNLRAR